MVAGPNEAFLNAPGSPSRPPLVELHLHLEGAITAERALSLWRGARDVPLPPAGGLCGEQGQVVDDPASFTRAVRWRFEDLPGFLRLFGWATRLLTLRGAYERVFADLLDALDRQGVIYAEIFVALGQMLRVGIDPAAVVPSLARQAQEHAERGGVDVHFVADATRQWGVAACEAVLDQALRLQTHRIVGLGMGGDEISERARRFRGTFRRAARAGLGRTCHAGEGTTADAVRETVEELEVTRVGHGIAAAADPVLMRELAEEGILLEVCPTSNRRTGVWRASEGPHPLHALVEHGVPVTLGSDDPAFFQSSTAGEWKLAASWGFSPEQLAGWNVRAAEAIFQDADRRQELRDRVRP
jgi:adenosine deaminase